MKKQRGEALIEAILALTVVIVIITAVVMAVVTSLSSSGSSESQNIANSYAQEGIEYLRDLKSSDYTTFTTYSSNGTDKGTWCLGEGSSPLLIDAANCDSPTEYNMDGKYIRKVYINTIGEDKKDPPKTKVCFANSAYVTSTVVWNDSKCAAGVNCHKVELSSCFINTDAVPTP